MPRRDPEIAEYDRRFRKEEEIGDIETFLEAYERATGAVLAIDEIGESPDAVCRRSDGRVVGVEHTRIRRSPEEANFQAIYYYQDEMESADTLDGIRIGAHREVRLYGLYPEHWRIITPRSMFDQKPYG